MAQTLTPTLFSVQTLLTNMELDPTLPPEGFQWIAKHRNKDSDTAFYVYVKRISDKRVVVEFKKPETNSTFVITITQYGIIVAGGLKPFQCVGGDIDDVTAQLASIPHNPLWAYDAINAINAQHPFST